MKMIKHSYLRQSATGAPIGGACWASLGAFSLQPTHGSPGEATFSLLPSRIMGQPG